MQHISFLSLPTELRCMVKDAISPSDLRTHVCFYLSDPSCTALYDSLSDADEFWQRLCWSCGIGMLPEEDLDGVTWRETAIESIQADGFCTHPQCGESLLEYNRQRMEDSAEYMEPGEVLLVDDYFRDYYEDLSLAAHRVFGRVSFRERNEHGLPHYGHGPPLAVDDDAYLRLDEAGVPAPIPENSARAYLGQHPLVSRSFATAAPVYNIYILPICDVDLDPHMKLDRQSRAVTVYDILDRLQKQLDRQMTVWEASMYVSGHERCFAKNNWSLKDVFGNLASLRSILAICPIRRLTNEENSSIGACFAIEQH